MKRLAGVAMAVGLALATTACPSNIHQTYKGFQSAVEKGAACEDLFDMRDRFDRTEDRTRADAELARVGCTSRDSARSDR